MDAKKKKEACLELKQKREAAAQKKRVEAAVAKATGKKHSTRSSTTATAICEYCTFNIVVF